MKNLYQKIIKFFINESKELQNDSKEVVSNAKFLLEIKSAKEQEKQIKRFIRKEIRKQLNKKSNVIFT